MINLETGHLIEGNAAAANVVDYTITGLRIVSGAPTEFVTTGQLAAAKGTLYTVKTGERLRDISILLCNDDTSARAVSLYLKTDGTNSRYIVNSLSLEANGGALIVSDQLYVYAADGSLAYVHAFTHDFGGAYHTADTWANFKTKISDDVPLAASDVDDTPVDGATTAPVSSNWAFDHAAAADPHTGYVKESEFTAADTVLVGTGAGTLGAVTLAASQFLAKKAAGAAVNVTATEARTILNVEDGADVTDATNVAAAGAVMEADYNAQTILAATVDDTPAALEITEQTVVGRITSGNIAALTVAQLQTLIFSAALPENVAIKLVTALSADGKYSAIAVEVGALGATVAFGECVYFKAVDSQWYLARANATATSGAVRLGICLVGGNDNDATVIMLIGKIRADAKFPTFTISAPIFVSAATAGLLTSTAPTGTTNFVVRIAAHAITGDEIFFCPDSTYLELA